MKWMKERDLLIAQTMAFVQSVTGRKPDAETAPATSAAVETSFAAEPFVFDLSTIDRAPVEPLAAAPDAGVIVAPPPLDAISIEPPMFKKPPISALSGRTDMRVDFQSEIRTRVASFRAHQERFSREREEYCRSTMAKVHAALREDLAPVRPGK